MTAIAREPGLSVSGVNPLIATEAAKGPDLNSDCQHRGQIEQ